jgi:hypothetical protein
VRALLLLPLVESFTDQTKIARLSTKSEIMALDTVHRIGLHERCVLEELGFQQPPTVLAIDNSAAITVMSGAHPGKCSGVKRVARRSFACQQERLLGHFALGHIPSETNPADLICAYKTPKHFAYLRDLVQDQRNPPLLCRALFAANSDPKPSFPQNLEETPVGGVVESPLAFPDDSHMPLPAKGSIRELANAAALRRKCRPLAGTSPSPSLAALFGNLNPIPTSRRLTQKRNTTAKKATVSGADIASLV